MASGRCCPSTRRTPGTVLLGRRGSSADLPSLSLAHPPIPQPTSRLRTGGSSRNGGRDETARGRGLFGIEVEPTRDRPRGTRARAIRPAPSGMRPHSGAPVTRGRSTRLLSSASPGSAGHEPMMTPSSGSDRAARASAVSAAVLSVPRPALATSTTPAADALVTQARGEVGERAATAVEPHEQPAGPLDEDDLRPAAISPIRFAWEATGGR